jgi:hypothetical protein
VRELHTIPEFLKALASTLQCLSVAIDCEKTHIGTRAQYGVGMTATADGGINEETTAPRLQRIQDWIHQHRLVT